MGSAIIAGKLLALRLLDDIANARASHDQDPQGQGHLRRRLRGLDVASAREMRGNRKIVFLSIDEGGAA